MKKMLAVIALVGAVSVASACGCYVEESQFQRAIEQCQRTGEAKDCNKAAAAQAKYNACLNKCMLEEMKKQ